MIPKIIHYCWFGGKPLSDSVKKCKKSWEKFCPDYQIVEWNETNTDLNCNNFVKMAYASKAWAFVSDYIRLKVIYEYGGIYLDTDVELIKSLDELLINKCYFPEDQYGKMIATGLGFGAEKKSEIIRRMMIPYEKLIFNNEDRLSISCPRLNTKVLSEYGFKYSLEIAQYDGFTVYPPKYFDPIGTGTALNMLCDETFSIHHYEASWTPYLQRTKRKIAIKIGYKWIEKIKLIRTVFREKICKIKIHINSYNTKK